MALSSLSKDKKLTWFVDVYRKRKCEKEHVNKQTSVKCKGLI